jgi:hypothetical protein
MNSPKEEQKSFEEVQPREEQVQEEVKVQIGNQFQYGQPKKYQEEEHPSAHLNTKKGFVNEAAPGSTTSYPPMESVVAANPGSILGKAPENGMDLLSKLNTIWIHQKAQYLEGCGCEFENIYSIYNAKDTEKDFEDSSQALFRCIEKSSCWQRNFCKPDMRAFHMIISLNHIVFNSKLQTYSQSWIPFLRFEREYTCTLLCFNRPVMRVIQIDGEQEQIIGFITYPWTCFDYVYDIREIPEGKPPFSVIGSCCQCGLYCVCPCGPCKEVKFQVFENSNKSIIGNISKVWPGCLKAMCSDADNYLIDFPIDLNPKLKSLIIATAIFMDYQHFETSPTRDNDEKKRR